jgi:hypothetical protein
LRSIGTIPIQVAGLSDIRLGG